MPETVSDALIDRLVAWGINVVFGLPGDGINGVMEALRRKQDRIRFVQVRHEEAAAFMACGYAKFTGKLGVCLATTGPGAIPLLNGLYDGKLHQAPGLARAGSDPFCEWVVRCQARPGPSAGPDRDDVPRPDRHPLSAGCQHRLPLPG